MTKQPFNLCAAFLMLLLLALPFGSVGQADIYVWTDENGTVHMQNYGKPQDVVVYHTYPEKNPSSSRKSTNTTNSFQQLLGPRNPDQNTGSQTYNLDELLKQQLEKQQKSENRIMELYNRYNRLNQLLKSTDKPSKQ